MSVTKTNKHSGFTIVELLIVIVVIAILAAISIVAYTGIQERSRDSIRDSDIVSIQKALELYYTEEGVYPSSESCGSSTINGHWCTTADASWSEFKNRIGAAGLTDDLPRDPVSAPGVSTTGGGLNYAYFSYPYERCGSQIGQWYLLAYAREAAQIDEKDDCSTGSPISSYGAASERLVIR